MITMLLLHLRLVSLFLFQCLCGAHEGQGLHIRAVDGIFHVLLSFLPVSSPPVVSAYQDHSTSESVEISFSMQKKIITKEHRNECLDVMGRIFGDGPRWSLAELFRVRCAVAAPYVVPY
ncbi:hypothetical protein IFM89_009724, partial [Coptis chinensis]